MPRPTSRRCGRRRSCEAHGDRGALTRLIDAFREADRAGRLPSGPVPAALAEGLGAFAAGDYEAAIRHIQPVAEEVIRLGGSHAQRDIFEETLIQAYLRVERGADAAPILERRLARRSSTRDRGWLNRANGAAGGP